MSVTSGSPIKRSDIEALFSAANGKTSLPSAPYSVPTASAWPDWVDPSSPGGSAYASGAQVSWGGGLFYSLSSGNTAIPTNATYWHAEVNQGTYSPSTTYHLLDVVGFTDVSGNTWNWISTATQTGNDPMTSPMSGPPGVPNANWIQHCLTAYNRLRTDLQTAVNLPPPSAPAGSALPQLTIWQQALFGPWPCAASVDYNYLVFTYPDTGGSEYVTVGAGVGSGVMGFAGNLSTWTNSTYQQCTNATVGTFVTTPETTSATYNLIVGGVHPVTLSGTFQIAFQYQQGLMWSGTAIVSDGTDPTALASVDASGWISGAGSWVKSSVAADAYNGAVIFTCTISGVTVNPGTYTVKLTGNIGGDDVRTNEGIYGWQITYPSRCYYLFSGTIGDQGVLLGTGVAYTVTISANTTAIGIHNSKTVYAIAVDNFDIHPAPTGLFSRDYTLTNTPSTMSPGTAFNLNGPFPNSAGVFGSAPGVWTGLIPPVGLPPFESALFMPWNLFFINGSGTVINPPYPVLPYTGGLAFTASAATRAYDIINEAGLSPQIWNADTYYPLGFTICDSNGNFQQVNSAGHSSSSPPTWSTTIGGVTAEPVYPGTGSHTGTNFPGVQWVMITSPCAGKPYNSAAARMFSQPAYPIMKSTDTWPASTAVAAGRLILDSNGDIRICIQPGTTGSTQPSWILGSFTTVTDGSAHWGFYLQGVGYGAPGDGTGTAGFTGGWIYRLNINDPAASGATSCQIGCIRSGSFVSFGTFTVGQSYDVMWPIFTNTPLVYVCSARIDVQTMFFGGGTLTTPPTPWGAIGWPLLASYYTDLNTILGLIV